MKPKLEILDTYPDFQRYWEKAQRKSVSKQVELWQTLYMNSYPELLDKQVQTYEKAKLDWHKVASRIFALLPGRLNLIRESRDNALAVGKTAFDKAWALEGDLKLTMVVYVGIGCGAGWATTYDNQPAILLGLENVAESRWHTKGKLKGLLCHEIGHLIHMKWRGEWETFEKAEDDPLFILYSEGFAQKCEHVILERETWHMAQNREWLSWCQTNLPLLAREYLRKVEKRAPVNDFFGSWFDIGGRSQLGYFLGLAFVNEMEETYTLREIAGFSAERVKKLSLKYLKSLKNAAVTS